MNDSRTEYLQAEEYQIPKKVSGRERTYNLKNRIGSGAVADMGVFLAEDDKGKEVVLKLSSPDKQGGVEREALLLARINSHVAKIENYEGALPVEYYETVEVPAKSKEKAITASGTVLEYAKGQPLDELLRYEKRLSSLSTRDALAIARQIGEFNLKVLHPLGKVDHDFQPRNYVVHYDFELGKRLRRFDFDQLKSLDLSSLKTEFGYLLNISLRLLMKSQKGFLRDDLFRWEKFVAQLSQDDSGIALARVLGELGWGVLQSKDLKGMHEAYGKFVKKLSILETASAIDKDPGPFIAISFIEPILEVAETTDRLVLPKKKELELLTLIHVAKEKKIQVSLTGEVREKLRDKLGVKGEMADVELLLDFISHVRENSNAARDFESGIIFIQSADTEVARTLMKEVMADLTRNDPFNLRYQRFTGLLDLEGKSWHLATRAAALVDANKIDEAARIFSEAEIGVREVDLEKGTWIESEKLKELPDPMKDLYYETQTRLTLSTALRIGEPNLDIPRAIEQLKTAKLMFDRIQSPLYRATLLAKTPELENKSYRKKLEDFEQKLMRGEWLELMREKIGEKDERIKQLEATVQRLETGRAELQREVEKLKKKKFKLF